MREIKFRYYDDSEKEMITWERVSDDFSIFALNPPYKNENPNDYIDWMQYAELKDKNGVEIYEEDILAVLEVSNWRTNEYRAPVEYGLSGFFLTEPDDTEMPLASFHYPEQACSTLFEIEVIGNIYEHPELLEGGEPDAN